MEFPQSSMRIMLLCHDLSTYSKLAHAVDEHNKKNNGDDAWNQDPKEEQIIHGHCVGHAEWISLLPLLYFFAIL